MKRIGSGSFGLVYSAKNVTTDEIVAIKLEPTNQLDTLTHEAAVLQKLSGVPGIPSLRYYGVPNHNRYMAMDLLGKTLQTVSADYKKAVPIGIVSDYAKQMMEIIRAVHERGFIHRDVKPPNFMLKKDDEAGGGLNKPDSKLYLIDFGLSRTYIDNHTKKHRCNTTRTGIIGTSRFVSSNIHDGHEPSRRDDLISIMYVVVYLAKGRLPWRSATSPEAIAQMKKQISPEDLFYELPSGYLEVFKYLSTLSYDEDPDYSHIIQKL